MWSRSELKIRGKAAFKKFYWKSVLVAFICALLTGGIGTGVRNTINDNFNYNSVKSYDDWKYEYEDKDINFDDNNSYSDFNEDAIGILDSIDGFFTTGAFIAIIMVGIIAFIVGFAIKLFIYYPIEIGKNNFFMGIIDGEKTLDSLIFVYKSGQLKNSIITMFLKGLYQVLWTFLLIVPGIIKSYEYRMIPYILSENPQISRKRAFEISKQMMKGNKWRTFVLDLSFIGWYILSAITMCILAIFYVNPYKESTNAELYAVLREDALKNGYATSDELIGF